MLNFLLMFLFIYLIGYFIIFRKWSSKTRPEASSCLISLFHGTPATILAVAAVFADSNRGFAAVNTPLQNLVLDYSTAYFVADLIHCVAFFAGDLLFVLHHLATLFVILTCRHVAFRGAFGVLSLLALAEVTSALQNAWALTRARRSDVAFAAKVFDALCVPFYGLYSMVRGVFGPYFVFKMVVFFFSGLAEGLIATWVWVSWVFVVSSAIVGSILWVFNLWVELYRERATKVEEKIR
ncbi:TLC domain-containing protein At5g14285-like [Abrus precatorius]|uniref:TLC domain-containing protein At5g14285-like n=1 Tax=Abrus precatorius TaxID=3816 RepID=A0A8B8LUF9_ABRPR|nr:TLC domain-containing protein At5g14285-like [Abrus precatorius]